MEPNSNIVTVRFLRVQGAEDLYRQVGGKRGVVLARIKKSKNKLLSGDEPRVTWCKCTPCGSGWEADAPLKAGTIIRVVNKANQELFREELVPDDWNAEPTALQRYWFRDDGVRELARDIRAALAENPDFIHHEAWRKIMREKRDAVDRTTDIDNWCYVEPRACDGGPKRAGKPFTRGGETFQVYTVNYEHIRAGLLWTQFILCKNQHPDEIEEIIGYALVRQGGKPHA